MIWFKHPHKLLSSNLVSYTYLHNKMTKSHWRIEFWMVISQFLVKAIFKKTNKRGCMWVEYRVHVGVRGPLQGASFHLVRQHLFLLLQHSIFQLAGPQDFWEISYLYFLSCCRGVWLTHAHHNMEFITGVQGIKLSHQACWNSIFTPWANLLGSCQINLKHLRSGSISLKIRISPRLSSYYKNVIPMLLSF